MESVSHHDSFTWPPLWSPTTPFFLYPTTSGHRPPPHTETHLSPIPQLPLQETVQGERDDVVQVLNLEKAESPIPHLK